MQDRQTRVQHQNNLLLRLSISSPSPLAGRGIPNLLYQVLLDYKPQRELNTGSAGFPGKSLCLEAKELRKTLQ